MSILKKIVGSIVLPLVALGLLTSFFIPSENLQVRIYAHLKISSAQLVINRGDYRVLADGTLFDKLKLNDVFKFSLKNDSLLMYKNDSLVGLFRYVKFVSTSEGELKVKLTDPDRKVRTYLDNMSVNVSESYIRLVNEIGIDNYIAGVTEAEAGTRASIEFYKVQAILARTFALAHINKHVTEGFSLCDQVHCQAYYGKPHDLSIHRAVEVTRGKVVVDENLNLIIAAFHSNSGGQTANSEDVWGTRTPYLKSIEDTFSLRMPNAKWVRKMLADDWLTYLKIKHNFPSDKPEGKEAALNFRQDARKIFLECNNVRIPLKTIRTDLQLKSTFFTITQLGTDSVLFTGRGYGHGLGMCQEGAMRMVRLGYSYTDILNFYYQNTQLIDLHKLNFFKDE
ncbi:MAG: SpoIID/LytB domain-containing protein [Bacteroidia bacterium]|nr:SpoIID/LytB domain-containing protein [Bacteroidia bacterium]